MKTGWLHAIATSIHPQAVGWWILAALAALVGLAVVGQALARQSRVESEDYPTMAALGADRRQLVALGMAQTLVVGLVGAIGAVAVAILLSPVAPLGEARVAENSTGLAFDGPVLLLGALGTLAAVLVLGLWPALRAARTRRADDRLVLSGPSVVVTQSGGGGRAAERCHRCAQRAGAKDRGGDRAVGECTARYGAGRPGAGRDRGIRRQPFAPDRHAPALRGHLPAQFHRPRQRKTGSRPSAEPRAGQGRHGNHRGHRHGDLREQGRGGGDCRHAGPGRAPPLDRRRDTFRTTTIRSASVRRPCARWVRTWVHSSTSPCPCRRAGSAPGHFTWCRRSPSRYSEVRSAWAPAP